MAEWTDTAISLGARTFGETDVILDVFTPSRGRTRGLVYGGISQKKRPMIEAGNTIEVQWKGKAEGSLGHFSVADATNQRAARYMTDPLALAGMSAAAAILREGLPEGEAKSGLYEASEVLLDMFGEPDIWPAIFIKWELGFLQQMGYGLNLETCVISGANDGLTHVSPKSGRAVRGSEAEAYLDKLLSLPAFLTDSKAPPNPYDIGAGFKLTGYFLTRRLFADINRDAPEARYLMLERLEKSGRILYTKEQAQASPKPSATAQGNYMGAKPNVPEHKKVGRHIRQPMNRKTEL
ncbi:DNA repair protein RecO [Hirschia litorea]|uniref:DNA repair protein RecO n=1 Tax=Hirschia litorea TaxID=1199156 RepID=A0ABW2IIC7_9PROT